MRRNGCGRKSRPRKRKRRRIESGSRARKREKGSERMRTFEEVFQTVIMTGLSKDFCFLWNNIRSLEVIEGIHGSGI